MSVQTQEKSKNHICVGVLAHVDAGKTTLSEDILYLTGQIRKKGRVDHGDTFLDTDEMEKSRGITIFSKQAVFPLGDLQVTLLDTPGHVDFSAEMERTLQVLDAAILVISGADGVQGHTETLWKLLGRYQIPVFLFVNKMDQPQTDPETILAELKKRLDDHCISFGRNLPEEKTEDFMEQIAMCEESLLEKFLENGVLEDGAVRSAIAERHVFPVYFGSALKGTGVEEFLAGFSAWATPYREKEIANAQEKEAPFGAKVFKITRDNAGNRLTHIKVTSGILKVKGTVSGASKNGESFSAKADQLRIYSGDRFELCEEVSAGMVCAITGLADTYAGQGLGAQANSDLPVLEPVLNYQVLPWGDTNIGRLLQSLKTLEEEEPELHVVWHEKLQEIHVQLMGQVQIDVLKTVLLERFGMAVNFGEGRVLYKETIAAPAEGVGHFEPLRHYAEVHLLLEPGEPGTGVQTATVCSEDVLDRNWQRLILTHVEEREHPGVLTGAALTDVRITLLTGRSHLKHTEGGDFRQATYRAVRQGLKKTESILLEPWYEFRIEVPSELVGRAMSDIQGFCGRFDPPELLDGMSVLTGSAPVASMQSYGAELASYSRGKGRLRCTVRGYEPCHNAEEVIRETGYDSELDLENPTGSVFCSHGAGYYIPWDEVENYMHLPYVWEGRRTAHAAEQESVTGQPGGGNASVGGADQPGGAMHGESSDQSGWNASGNSMRQSGQPGSSVSGQGKTPSDARKTGAGYAGSSQAALDKELEAIFTREFGPVTRRQSFSGYTELSPSRKKWNGKAENEDVTKKQEQKNFNLQHSKVSRERYLLVDGYNIVHAWPELRELAETNLDAARGRLQDILCNYQGYKGCTLILVFDAYKVKGNLGTMEDYHNIHVVYTKEAETADEYIAKVTHEIGKTYPVTVATSDNLEQLIVMGQGAVRLSAQEFREEVDQVLRSIRNDYLNRQAPHRFTMERFMEDKDSFTE